MDSQNLHRSLLIHTLQKRFGLSRFRGLQMPVIEALLSGHDVLALMPTGAGKSLCYQLPAIILTGVTVVITPLIALMRDQVRRLEALHISSLAIIGDEDLQAGLIRTSSLIKKGGIKIILTSPERTQMQHFLKWLASSLPSAGLGLLVIDEAHCITEWGRAFRPAYRELGDFRALFPCTPVLAMTASADQNTIKDIMQVLRMPQHAVMRSSLNRPELFYKVTSSTSPWRSATAYLQKYHAHHCAIFYCSMRQESEQLAKVLQHHGFNARFYHAGMNLNSRARAEQWFLDADQGVMVATIAFGMGIDKSNVRLVAHVGLEHRLAAYYQETGRAGRDGENSDVLLVLSQREYDQVMQHEVGLYGIENQLVDDDEIQSKAYFGAFVRNTACRRVALLAGLDEIFEGNCNACDYCLPNYRPMPFVRENASRWVPKRL